MPPPDPPYEQPTDGSPASPAPEATPISETATPPVSDSHDEEKVRDRRHAVVTTIIAGLLGGVLGAVVSLIGTREQIDSQRSQAKSEFLQTQRIAAYATFLTDEAALDRAEVGLGIITDPKLGRANRSNYSKLRQPLDDAYRKVLQDEGTVSIIGSPKASDLARKITDIHVSRYYWVIVGDGYTANNLGTDAEYRSVSPGILSSSGELTTLEQEFVGRARIDLGSG
ncbi:hypothetical protein [Micromonospora fulviviridis]|uniref:Uncharacterized protein n=1 Tax=Micromonospora fulviviridis TaxID=47860 RepID=A0ABV2VFG1_9ACTN